MYQSEVYSCATEANSTPIQLTQGARGTETTHGVADFCAQEEMDRYDGYWFSPDGKSLAFEAVDESHIPNFRIMHSGKETVVQEASQFEYRSCSTNFPVNDRTTIIPSLVTRIHVSS